MNQVIDIDLQGRYAWQGALKMILALCGEAADLSFDCRKLNAWQPPTVEFRLDKPEELKRPKTVQTPNGYVDTWPRGTVIVTDRMPETFPEGPVWLLKEGGAASVIYHAFLETVRVLTELGLPVVYAWSSIPLATVCDDLARLRQRESDCYLYGAIHTIWVRCPEDVPIREALSRMHLCGELRVQNMATANTWIRGAVDERRLLCSLQGGAMIHP